MGKNLETTNFENLTSMDEGKLSKEISETFVKNRDERIKFLGEKQSQEIEKEFFYNR